MYGDSIKEEMLSPGRDKIVDIKVEATRIDDYDDKRKSINLNKATFITPNQDRDLAMGSISSMEKLI